LVVDSWDSRNYILGMSLDSPKGSGIFEDGILGHPGTSLIVNILGDSQGEADDLLTTVTAAACQ